MHKIYIIKTKSDKTNSIYNFISRETWIFIKKRKKKGKKLTSWDKRRLTASLGCMSHSFKSCGNPCYTTNANKGLPCLRLGSLVIWINSWYPINNHHSNLKVSKFVSFCYSSDGYILAFEEKSEKRLKASHMYLPVPARRSASFWPMEEAVNVFPLMWGPCQSISSYYKSKIYS